MVTDIWFVFNNIPELFLGVEKLSPAKTEMENDIVASPSRRESGGDGFGCRRSSALDDAAGDGNGSCGGKGFRMVFRVSSPGVCVRCVERNES